MHELPIIRAGAEKTDFTFVTRCTRTNY